MTGPAEVGWRAPTGATTVAAVIGSPVRHTLSPAIHNAAFAATGLDWLYLAFEVVEGRAPAALDAMRTLGFGGLSVTMPHKAAVAASVDRCTPAAERLGAVNCVVPVGPDLLGDNTDGVGFVASLRHDAGLDPRGLRVVVLGAGGAARAVVLALADAGAAEIVVVNRDDARGRVAAALAGARGSVGSSDAVADADLVVNATPLGMTGVAAGELPCDPDRLGPGQTVVDLVYEPVDTAWLLASRASGARTVDGLGMLVHQAAVAFEKWTGLPPPLDAMRAGVVAELARRAPRVKS